MFGSMSETPNSCLSYRSENQRSTWMQKVFTILGKCEKTRCEEAKMLRNKINNFLKSNILNFV